MSFELSKSAQKIGQEVGDEAGRKLDALLGAGEGTAKTPVQPENTPFPTFPPLKAGHKLTSPITGLKNSDKAVPAEQGLAGSGVELNPSPPPFTEREEKAEPVEKFAVPERPGGSEKTAIELTEIAGEPEKESKKSEEIEIALAKAREEYVAAEEGMAKAGKEEAKLTGLRAKIMEFFKAGITSYETDKTRIPERQEKISGAQAEAQEAKEKFVKAQENYKAAIRAYRDSKITQIDKKAEEFKAAGKMEEEMRKNEIEKYAKDILLAATLREAVKIDSLRTDKQIEQMGKARRLVNEKAEEFTDWYRKLPWQAKVGVSAGLTGVGILTGSAAVLTAVFAGQAALRALGGAMTAAGVEKLVENLQEKSGEKKLTKEFDGKFLEALKNQGDELDNKLFEMVKGQQSAKNKRFVAAGLVGGVVGTGILATAVKEAFGWGGGGKSTAKMPKVGFKGAPIISVEDELRHWLGEASSLPDAEKPSGAGEVDASGPKGGGGAVDAGGEPKDFGAAGVEKPVAEAGGVGKVAQEVITLEIGSRGPEGAIIDNFRANPELAKSFGWDGKADISKWAGTKAHQIWLASVENELAKSGMAEKLTEQGFTADAEGYAKAMHKIGKGFVEIDPAGNMHLSDNTSFLKVTAAEGAGDFTKVETDSPKGGASIVELPRAQAEFPATEIPGTSETPEAPAPPAEPPSAPAPPGPETALTPEELTDKNIKDTVTRLVGPGILTDKTFKAAGKLTLGKILEEIPEAAYKDKYALSNYWHSLSGVGVKTPDLPGTGFLGDLSYDDIRKYAEMTKLLRENPVLKSAVGLKNMTVEEFFKIYGGDLAKIIKK